MHAPDFSYEEELWQKGHHVIGIDEVGRGAFAGPVGIGGVIFSPHLTHSQKESLLTLGINDSKKLSNKKRTYLSSKIKELAEMFSVCFTSVERINEVGIGKATFEGMREVISKTTTHNSKPANIFALVDAFTIPEISIPQRGIVRGDSLSLSIAAASIIAKVERDKMMEELGGQIPLYQFEKHKGYGTSLHRSLITMHGISSYHRVDFCKNILAKM